MIYLMRFLCTLILSVFALLSVIDAVQGRYAQLEDVTQFLEAQCLSICDLEMKDENICAQFCEFVPHIAQNHEKLLLPLVDSVEEPYDFTTLEYALRRTMGWRRKVGEANPHATALFFVKEATIIQQDRKHHDEL